MRIVLPGYVVAAGPLRADTVGVFGSPTKGLFVYSPVLLLSFYAIPSVFRINRPKHVWTWAPPADPMEWKRGFHEILSAAVVHGALLARSAAWHRAGDLRHVGKLGHYRAHAIGMGHMADRKGIQGADRRTITASATGGPAEPHVEFLSISRIPL